MITPLTDAAALRCVVFDLGGVLVRICRSWAQGCAAAGVAHAAPPNTPNTPAPPETPTLIARRHDLVRRYEIGLLSTAQFVDGLTRALGGAYTHDQVRAVHDAWLLGQYAGAEALIDELHALGLVTGVLSNTNAGHWHHLVTGPLAPVVYPALQRVHHVHASHLLGLAKPDRAVYDAFARASGLPPASLVFFDDLPENVQGAQAAGWHAVHVSHAPSDPQAVGAPPEDPIGQVRAALRRLGLPLTGPHPH